MRDNIKELMQIGMEDFISSILLIGPPEFPMMKDAMAVASMLLDTEDPARHPDFMLCGIEEGKKSIGVETAGEILRFSSSMPSAASKRVIIVDEINKMTVEAQNKLLKLIEESQSVVVVGVAYEDNLLPTIKSRVRIFRYTPTTYAEYVASGEGKADPVVYYYASGGIPGAEIDSTILQTFQQVKEAVEERNKRALFLSLGLVQEKDKNMFFTAHRQQVGSTLSLIGHCLTNMQLVNPEDLVVSRSLKVIADHKERCNKLQYSKDDFFACIAGIL